MTKRTEEITARERMCAGLRRYLDSLIVVFFFINLCLPVYCTENVLYCRGTGSLG